MRLTAYVLAADPAYLAESLRAYYPRVERIVVSYDETSTSWTGTPLPVEECLALVRSVDTDGKCVLAPGGFARLDHGPFENETFQRQVALDQASEGADWVLQLDTDEVMASPARFLGALRAADEAGAGGLEYPSRWLYAHVGPGRFLEASTRFGRSTASFPGSLAVRAGTTLRQARQADVPLYRVDVRPWNTDPHHPADAVVHQVVPLREAVVHYSWVRSDDQMRRKFGWSGHADRYSEPAVYRKWAWRSAHPLLTVASNPLRGAEWFRFARIVEPT